MEKLFYRETFIRVHLPAIVAKIRLADVCAAVQAVCGFILFHVLFESPLVACPGSLLTGRRSNAVGRGVFLSQTLLCPDLQELDNCLHRLLHALHRNPF